MSKRAKAKALKIAERERLMAEKESMDSLEELMIEMQEAAVEIRGMRDSTTRDLQRIISDDVLGNVMSMGREFGERDEDHDVRLMRVEAALGLGALTEDEYNTLTADAGEEGEEFVAPVKPATPDEMLAAVTQHVPLHVLQQAVSYLRNVCECVAEGRIATEEERAQGKELLQLVELVEPYVQVEAEVEAGEEVVEESEEVAETEEVVEESAAPEQGTEEERGSRW